MNKGSDLCICRRQFAISFARSDLASGLFGGKRKGACWHRRFRIFDEQIATVIGDLDAADETPGDQQVIQVTTSIRSSCDSRVRHHRFMYAGRNR